MSSEPIGDEEFTTALATLTSITDESVDDFDEDTLRKILGSVQWSIDLLTRYERVLLRAVTKKVIGEQAPTTAIPRCRTCGSEMFLLEVVMRSAGKQRLWRFRFTCPAHNYPIGAAEEIETNSSQEAFRLRSWARRTGHVWLVGTVDGDF